MRFYRRVSTMGNLKAIYKHACKTCNPEMKGAISDALDDSVVIAKVLAPVYDPEKWLTWWGYEHHYTKPGTLRDSIRHTKPVAHARGASYTATFGAYAPFASHIEQGFKHKKAHKKILGRKFMQTSYNVAFVPTINRNFDIAVKRMLLTPTTGGL